MSKTTTLAHRCEHCRVWRRRLFLCHVCDKKLCGWCSFKRESGANAGLRVCAGGGECHKKSKEVLSA